MTEHSRT